MHSLLWLLICLLGGLALGGNVKFARSHNPVDSGERVGSSRITYQTETHKWRIGTSENRDAPPIKLFYATLAKLRTLLSQKSLGFRILLEFDEPK